jgi:toxin FitB
MIILDTNVLSALMQQNPDTKVLAWLDRQPRTSIWTTAITVLEIRFGLQVMAVGRRRDFLMHGFDILLEKIDHRVAPFDDSAARHASELMAVRHKKGRLGDLRDTMIAGVVLAQHGTLATRNTTHFGDISPVVNPWNT